LNQVILFFGSLGFPDSEADSYRRTLRMAHATGLHLLKMNAISKVYDYGIDSDHAVVLFGVIRAWKGEFKIVGNPNPLESHYIPDYGGERECTMRISKRGRPAWGALTASSWSSATRSTW